MLLLSELIIITLTYKNFLKLKWKQRLYKKKERDKNLSQEEADKIKEHQRKKYEELVQYIKDALKDS